MAELEATVALSRAIENLTAAEVARESRPIATPEEAVKAFDGWELLNVIPHYLIVDWVLAHPEVARAVNAECEMCEARNDV